MMPIDYTNNFQQYDNSIIAFHENEEKEITYGYVEKTIEKDSRTICSRIHCFNKICFDWNHFIELKKTEVWCYTVNPKNSLYKINYAGLSLGKHINSLFMRKATLLETQMLIKDNDTGMIGASEEIKKLVHEKFKEMLAPSYKMFILGHNDNESQINMIPKDVVFEIIKLSNQ